MAKSPTPKPAAAPAHPTTAAAAPAPAPAETGPIDLDHLTEGEHVHGFTATALYLDDADHPMGARFGQEPARLLRCKPGTVNSRLHYACEHLRRKLARVRKTGL